MKKVVSLVLSLLMVISLIPTVGFATTQGDVPSGTTLIKATEYRIAPGITEEDTALLNANDQQNMIYTATIDPSVSTVGFLAGYADYNDTGKWKMQTVRDQAAAAESKTGKKIVAAINGDYFNMQTGEPLGALVMNGKVVHDVGVDVGYFAILKDGTAVCRDASVPLTDVAQAIGSPIWLLRDGQNLTDGNPDMMPRGAVGIKADGKIVILINDGRQAPKSIGLTLFELAEYMKGQGCVDALYLDGGGSATFTSVREGTGSLAVQNSPSDGVERQVSSSLLIYSTAKSDGSCDHVSISPKNEIYTPGSEVQFKAVGVDSVGGKADLPKDGHFTLADDSFGTITADGKFVSNGKTGVVTVKYESAALGNNSCNIQIQTPDSITFVNEQISLDFEESNDLGLTVKYKNQDVNYKSGDFEWSVSDILDANKQPIEGKPLGTFDGNIFTSSDGTTLYGTITCVSKYDAKVKGSILAIIGLQPTVVMDFEDLKDAETGETIMPAKDYWTFKKTVFNASGGEIHALWDDGDATHWSGDLRWYNGEGTEMPVLSKLLHGGYYDGDPRYGSRGGSEYCEIVNIASGEPVRKGNCSLKLNYDFSKWVTGVNATDGACIGFSEASQTIPGMPTAIGMYVYCPEGTPNLDLRLRLKDGNGTVQTLVFTKLGEWTGWKYVEVDLTELQGPFSLIGGETIRVMRYKGCGNTLGDGSTIPDSQCKGALYFDNLQFVYGANTTDVDNPTITDIKANNVTLADDGKTEIASNNVSFDITMTDVLNKYTSGVNYDTVNVILDGENITDAEKQNIAVDPSKDMVALYNQYLANGAHNIQVTVKDNEDNETTFTREFVVNGNANVTPAIVVTGNDTVYVGTQTTLNVTSDNLANTEKVNATVKISGIDVDKDSFVVEYADGYEEAAAPVYKDKAISISAKKVAGAELSGQGTVALIKVMVPKTAAETDYFGYTVTKGKAEFANCEKTAATFTAKLQKASIAAKYFISNGVIPAGEDATFTVTDVNGNIVKGISIYNAVDNTRLGSTDKRGRFTTSLLRELGNLAIYAQADDGMSFVKKLHSFVTGANEDGTPAFVSVNASADSQTEKNITWISNPDVNEKTAVAQVATKAAYDANGESAFTDYVGKADDLVFDGSTDISANRYVYSNKVTVDGLKRGTEYVYRVGDGEIWSDVYSFTTAYKGTDTKFFLIGDTQADEFTKITNIANKLATDGGYSFGVQTGDFTETASIYAYWDAIMNAFGADYFKTVDMIHVTGNHELYGDGEGTISRNLFNIESQQHYSVEYGNVYVAVLGYDSTEAGAKADAEWLVADAAASNARWKIVVSHQPAYGTNATTDDCRYITEYITAACDEAGIDFMFSGHDHSFATTYPVYNGERADANEGTVYYVIGSTGEKSYGVTADKKLHRIATQDFDGLYFTVEATDTEITVKAMDNNGETLADTYTKTKAGCKVHDYMVTDDGMLICKKCGHAETIGTYTGLVTGEETGKIQYLNKGKLATSCWVNIGDDAYYFDKNGFALTGKCKLDIETTDINGNAYTIKDAEYTFDENGKYVKGAFVDEKVTDAEGNTKTITRYYEAGGAYAVHWVEIDGSMYYFKKTSNKVEFDTGMMYTGDGTTLKKVKTVGNNSNRYYVFGEDGKLVVGAFSTDDNGNTRYYWGDEYVTGDVNVAGIAYHFDEATGYMKSAYNLKDCNVKMSSYVTYTGSKVKPKITVKCGDVTLVQGRDYKVTYAKNKAIGKATATIEPMTKEIRTGVVSNVSGFTGKVIKTFKIVPAKVKDVKASSAGANAVKLSWTAQTGITGYKVYRATSKNGTYKMIKTIADPTKTSFTNTGRTAGVTYYYKVRTYKVVDGNDYYSINSTIISAKPMPKTVSFTAKSASYNSVKLSWTAQSGITGYKVYRATSKDGAYKLIKTISDPKQTTFTNSGLKTGKTYYYRVKAYKTVNDTNVIGSSYYKSVTPKLGKATIASLNSAAASSVTVKWNKVSGANGYKIYRATSKTGEYTCIKTVDSSKTVSYTNKSSKLKAGKTYYYKVKAYRLVDGEKVYGAYSSVKSVKVAK